MENKYSIDVWEDYYKNEKKIHIKPKSGFFQSYDIFLCDSILSKYLPHNGKKREEMKICEIGFGDGKLLRKVSDQFNYEPFGIEYSKEGIKQAQGRGIKTIEGDAFDDAILKKYHEFFDVVFSYGFIEHIIPPEKAVQMHMKLLKKRGYIIIQLPRFKKFNWLKAKIFRPDLLPLHNLAIMEEEIISSLVKKEGIQEIFCKNYGTLKLRIPMSQKNIRWYVLKAISCLEYVLNPLFRLLFRDKGFETKLFSPAIIFIGRKA